MSDLDLLRAATLPVESPESIEEGVETPAPVPGEKPQRQSMSVREFANAKRIIYGQAKAAYAGNDGRTYKEKLREGDAMDALYPELASRVETLAHHPQAVKRGVAETYLAATRSGVLGDINAGVRSGAYQKLNEVQFNNFLDVADDSKALNNALSSLSLSELATLAAEAKVIRNTREQAKLETMGDNDMVRMEIALERALLDPVVQRSGIKNPIQPTTEDKVFSAIADHATRRLRLRDPEFNGGRATIAGLDLREDVPDGKGSFTSVKADPSALRLLKRLQAGDSDTVAALRNVYTTKVSNRDKLNMMDSPMYAAVWKPTGVARSAPGPLNVIVPGSPKPPIIYSDTELMDQAREIAARAVYAVHSATIPGFKELSEASTTSTRLMPAMFYLNPDSGRTSWGMVAPVYKKKGPLRQQAGFTSAMAEETYAAFKTQVKGLIRDIEGYETTGLPENDKLAYASRGAIDVLFANMEAVSKFIDAKGIRDSVPGDIADLKDQLPARFSKPRLIVKPGGKVSVSGEEMSPKSETTTSVPSQPVGRAALEVPKTPAVGFTPPGTP